MFSRVWKQCMCKSGRRKVVYVYKPFHNNKTAVYIERRRINRQTTMLIGTYDVVHKYDNGVVGTAVVNS